MAERLTDLEGNPWSLWQVETATGMTGPTNFGPVDVVTDTLVRFYGPGVNGQEGSILIELPGGPGDGPTGPTGPVGPPGIAPTGGAGDQGADGPTGGADTTGAQGTQGTTGAQGNAGPQGSQGGTGPVGPQGSQGGFGPTGAMGATGSEGTTGPQGPQGSEGITGPQGSQGSEGITGPQGPQGAQGAQGPTGGDGPQGQTGPQGAQGNTGQSGPQGAQGAGGLTGEIGNTGADGVVGPDGVMGGDGGVGTTGPQGAQGNIGQTGPQGSNGQTGPQGDIGAMGNVGAEKTGITGPQGAVGEQGATGMSGVENIGQSGPQGPVGPQGEVGNTGNTGALGMTGMTGALGMTGAPGGGVNSNEGAIIDGSVGAEIDFRYATVSAALGTTAPDGSTWRRFYIMPMANSPFEIVEPNFTWPASHNDAEIIILPGGVWNTNNINGNLLGTGTPKSLRIAGSTVPSLSPSIWRTNNNSTIVGSGLATIDLEAVTIDIEPSAGTPPTTQSPGTDATLTMRDCRVIGGDWNYDQDSINIGDVWVENTFFANAGITNLIPRGRDDATTTYLNCTFEPNANFRTDTTVYDGNRSARIDSCFFRSSTGNGGDVTGDAGITFENSTWDNNSTCFFGAGAVTPAAHNIVFRGNRFQGTFNMSIGLPGGPSGDYVNCHWVRNEFDNDCDFQSPGGGAKIGCTWVDNRWAASTVDDIAWNGGGTYEQCCWNCNMGIVDKWTWAGTYIDCSFTNNNIFCTGWSVDTLNNCDMSQNKIISGRGGQSDSIVIGTLLNSTVCDNYWSNLMRASAGVPVLQVLNTVTDSVFSKNVAMGDIEFQGAVTRSTLKDNDMSGSTFASMRFLDSTTRCAINTNVVDGPIEWVSAVGAPTIGDSVIVGNTSSSLTIVATGTFASLGTNLITGNITAGSLPNLWMTGDFGPAFLVLGAAGMNK